MKARLEYFNSLAAWDPIGNMRSIQKDYTINPILLENRIGQPEIAGYNVRCRAVIFTSASDNPLTSAPTILDGTDMAAIFRINCYDDSLTISLGERPYQINYNIMSARNEIEMHEIIVEFTIDRLEYSDYAIPTT